MNTLRSFLLVGLGGASGAMLRYFFSSLFQQQSFPYATLLINIVGSFVMGLLIAMSLKYLFVSKEMILFAATGLCGGFTTFSAFSIENLRLLQDGKYLLCLLYVLSSILFCIAATWLGYKLIHV